MGAWSVNKGIIGIGNRVGEKEQLRHLKEKDYRKWL